MGLTLPVPTVTPGPLYGSQNNAAFELIDSHDHSVGRGVPVRTEGLNIDNDLPLQSNNATLVRSVRFLPNATPLALPADLGCVYIAGGDFWFNNAAGQQIQITAGGALNAASIGGIGGDYTTSTASVFYLAAQQKFFFTQNTNNAALMDFGAMTVRAAGVSANGVTIKAPAGLAASYETTLPTALPADPAALVLNNAGLIRAIIGAFLPVGAFLDFAGTTAPPGFLECDGSEVSRTTYADLFAVIGTIWGPGDGTTTFNLPDARRRTNIGKGGSVLQSPGNIVGNVGGEQEHVQTINEIAAHDHEISDPGHSHQQFVGAGGASLVPQSTTANVFAGANFTGTSTTGVITLNSGGSEPFNVMQPSMTVTRLIKF
jgi:microcystin-dependent protein